MNFSGYQIANFIIDHYPSDTASDSLTNLKINKLVFFLHVETLANFGEPLISSKIEAWDHGPVIRELYRAFKRYGESKITKHAETFDPKSNRIYAPQAEISDSLHQFLKTKLRIYAQSTANELRNLSHVKGGPWDNARKGIRLDSLGGRISNESILEYYSSSRKVH